MAKKDITNKILEAIQDKFGKKSATMLIKGSRSEVTEAIPTGVTVLDKYIIGCGGVPVGKMIEVYGPEGCGKTSLALSLCAQAQRLGGVAILADTEHAVQIERAKVFGVDLNELLLLQPDSMEETIDQLYMALGNIPEKAGPIILVWDSIAATPPQAELDASAGEAKMGAAARLMNRCCRVLNPLMSKRRVALVFINQVREKIGVVFGDPTTTPGGSGPKFYASVRLQMWAGKMVKNAAGEAVGRYVTIKAMKNRLTFPHRKASVLLNFSTGWDNEWTTLEHAKNLDLVKADAKGGDALAQALEKLDACQWASQ